MATTKEDISIWFDRVKSTGDTYMIVACDTFSYEDYPVGAKDADECLDKLFELRHTDMTRVMEVYDLCADKAAQLNEPRCMRVPDEWFTNPTTQPDDRIKRVATAVCDEYLSSIEDLKEYNRLKTVIIDELKRGGF